MDIRMPHRLSLLPPSAASVRAPAAKSCSRRRPPASTLAVSRKELRVVHVSPDSACTSADQWAVSAADGAPGTLA